MADYLRSTIAEIDEAIAQMTAHRRGLAVRLAVIEAAASDRVAEGVADLEVRARENRPYEDAESAEKLLGDAHKHFCS